MARRRRRRRRGSPLWRYLFFALLVAAGVYFGGKLLVSPGGRYWTAQNIWRGSPSRVKPVVEDALARTARDLDLPPPYPQLFCEPDTVGRAVCRTDIRLAPGMSTIQANAALTGSLTDLGLDLIAGVEQSSRSVLLDFQAGSRTRIQLRLIPATATGLDTVVTPDPALPPIEVRVRIALIIENYGRDPGLSRRFNELPGTFTAAVYPEMSDARDWADRARSEGMEVLLNLPMEPKSFPTQNPGPNAILVDLSGRAIRKLVDRGVDRLGSVAGVKTFMGGLAVEDRDVMRAVLEEVKSRDLYFVDSTQEEFSVARPLGREIDLPVIAIPGFGDVDKGHNNSGTIGIRFDDFIKACEAKGYGVGTVHLRSGTLEVLESRLPVLARDGIVVMGLSEIVRAEQLTAYP